MTRWIGIDQELYAGFGVDIVDAVIVEHIKRLLLSEHPKIVEQKRRGYVWIDYGTILRDNPLLQISEKTLQRRLDRLRDIGLLESFTKAINGSKKRTWYKLGPAFFQTEQSLDERATDNLTVGHGQFDPGATDNLTVDRMVRTEGETGGEDPHQIEEQRSEESGPSTESGPDLEDSPSSPPLENWLSILEKVSYSESELSELRKRGARDYCAVKRFVADYKGDRPRLSTYFKQRQEWIDKSSVDYTHYREAIEANERYARLEEYREMGLNDFAAERALDMSGEELADFLKERGVA